MGLSCTVSKKDGDISRKSQICPITVYLTPKRFPLELCIGAWGRKQTRMMGLPHGRKRFEIGLAVQTQHRRATSRRAKRANPAYAWCRAGKSPPYLRYGTRQRWGVALATICCLSCLLNESQLSVHRFLPSDAICKRGLCCRPVSVCPSVRHVGGLYTDG